MKPEFNDNYKGIRCRVYLVRENVSEKDQPIPINNSQAVYELIGQELVTSDRERILSVMLTSKHHLIGVETVSIGSIRGSAINPADIFKSAILANASAIIICHNHPSGDLTPSRCDEEFTRELVRAGKILGIKLLDHLIISHRGYRSLVDNETVKWIKEER